MSLSINSEDAPARKLRVADLASLSHGNDVWRYSRGDISFDAPLVWLQGTTRDISDDRTEVVLSDEDAAVTLVNCDRVPGGVDWLSQGSYIMAVGLVMSAGQGCPPVVSVLRLSDLTDNPAHKLSWPAEVTELKFILNENSALENN